LPSVRLVRGTFVHATLQGKDSFTQGVGDGTGTESHEAVGVGLCDRGFEVFHLAPAAGVMRRHVSIGWDFQEGAFAVGDQVCGPGHPSPFLQLNTIFLQYSSAGSPFGYPESYIDIVVAGSVEEGE